MINLRYFDVVDEIPVFIAFFVFAIESETRQIVNALREVICKVVAWAQQSYNGKKEIAVQLRLQRVLEYENQSRILGCIIHTPPYNTHRAR